MLSVYSIFERVDPYIPIAFLLVSLLLFYNYSQNYHQLCKQIIIAKVNILFKYFKEERIRFLKLKRLVNKFVLLILSIEIAINVIGTAGWLTVDNMSSYRHRPLSINISEDCQIYHSKNLIVLTKFNSWILYLLTRIVEVISLTLLPTICCALEVIRCAILSHPNGKSIKKWTIYISARSIIMLVLSNTFYTYVIFVGIQILLFWLDLVIYFIYARRFYKCLKSRREAAQIQSLNSDCTYTKLEYQRLRNSALHFKLSTVFTFILELALILQVSINSFLFIITTELHNSCYFSFISLGYLERIQFGTRIVHLFDRVKFYFYMSALALSYIHQILMFIAYVILFCSVNRCFTIKTNNHQLLRRNIKDMIKYTYGP